MHDTAMQAAAQLMLERGMGAVSVGAVQAVTGISRDRLVRAYRSTTGLTTAVYIEGHTRARALCAAGRYPGATGVDTVAACAAALLEQAATDPVVRVVHALEMTSTASTTGRPSIYQVWTAWMIETLTSHSNAPADQHAHDVGVVPVLVAALAGMCAPHARHHHLPLVHATRARSQAVAALGVMLDQHHHR